MSRKEDPERRRWCSKFYDFDMSEASYHVMIVICREHVFTYVETFIKTFVKTCLFIPWLSLITVKTFGVPYRWPLVD